jgi:hypothetical protein
MYTVFGTIAGLSIILRALSKHITHSAWSWDDNFVVITFVAGMCGTGLGAHDLVKYGAGQDIVSTTDNQLRTLQHIL